MAQGTSTSRVWHTASAYPLSPMSPMSPRTPSTLDQVRQKRAKKRAIQRKRRLMLVAVMALVLLGLLGWVTGALWEQYQRMVSTQVSSQVKMSSGKPSTLILTSVGNTVLPLTGNATPNASELASVVPSSVRSSLPSFHSLLRHDALNLWVQEQLSYPESVTTQYTQTSLQRLGWERFLVQPVQATMVPLHLVSRQPTWLHVSQGWRFGADIPVVQPSDIPLLHTPTRLVWGERYLFPRPLHQALEARYALPFVSPLHAPMDAALTQKLTQLFARTDSSLTPHVYVYHPASQQSVNLHGNTPVSSASVIKLPLLYMLALRYPQAFTSLSSLGTTLPSSVSHTSTWSPQARMPQLFTDTLRAGGSGHLNFMPAGGVYDLHQVAKYMIQSSDNSCTNMVIQTLGGLPTVHAMFEAMGFQGTQLRDWLPDLAGYNTLTPHDMVSLLYHLRHTDRLSPSVKQTVLSILKGTLNRSLLTGQLPASVPFYHKTGDIGTALADAGFFVLPNGEEVFIAIQVERPFNAPQARPLIQAVGHLVYTHYLP
ncbi:MAG: serine hydrolase [Vampirovibrionales bacterium]